jgi:hypothetical protein
MRVLNRVILQRKINHFEFFTSITLSQKFLWAWVSLFSVSFCSFLSIQTTFWGIGCTDRLLGYWMYRPLSCTDHLQRYWMDVQISIISRNLIAMNSEIWPLLPLTCLSKTSLRTPTNNLLYTKQRGSFSVWSYSLSFQSVLKCLFWCGFSTNIFCWFCYTVLHWLFLSNPLLLPFFAKPCLKAPSPLNWYRCPHFKILNMLLHAKSIYIPAWFAVSQN